MWKKTRQISPVLGTNSPGTNRLRYQSSMGCGNNSPVPIVHVPSGSPEVYHLPYSYSHSGRLWTDGHRISIVIKLITLCEFNLIHVGSF